ncbi:DUF5686 and carboxypeptidase regulatory-like domain-containing protein [Gilvibacter sp.]|uniref:DUF5686 and carboxypeptidase regulatory-like domain-containing protein n=1 Tax=Gilvibacter sp. TaxID=2729997 RepID=UPI0035BE4D5B
MQKPLLLLFLFLSASLQAQIKGRVTDSKGEPLPFVNIFVQDSYLGTTSNELGDYVLELPEAGTYTLVFQYLGFEVKTQQLEYKGKLQELNMSLQATSLSLDEVVIDASEDPAYRIIRQAIANRKKNSQRIAAFTADFYSKGLWKVTEAPERIMGEDIGDFGGALDSTRTGIIYLSETISEIAYQQPDDFKERIIASKVSGNDNGFSFNSAGDANFSFYNNTIDINAQLVSPIANNALEYYRYKLEGVFYENDKLINKILVTPKRSQDRIWEGYVYIVEDDWEFYGIDLSTSGTSLQIPFVKELVFKQNFTFDKENRFWVKISQTIDFSFGLFGLNGDGRFTAVYSDYDFSPGFTKQSFTNEVLTFVDNANEKDSLYWNQVRPVPLTPEEISDYIRKDSIQTLRKSKTYLDSIDAGNNRPSLLAPLTGYTYRNSYERWNISYDGPSVQFNTIQGYVPEVGLRFFKGFDENYTKWLSFNSRFNYGIDEDRFRFDAGLTYRFNAKNRARLSVNGGVTVAQFNRREPISPFVNTISSLAFERNYLKAYELRSGAINYGQEVVNGLFLTSRLAYEERVPLFNTSDQVWFRNSGVSYTSNNPLDPTDFENAAINKHNIVKAGLSAFITIGQKYMSYPDFKFNVGGDNRFPRIQLNYEGGFAASNDNYNFHQFSAGLYQSFKIGNKGRFRYNLKGGTFVNGEGISFVDFQHFNGNQTRVNDGGVYTNVFNNLPYYALSTNDSYMEFHAEHHFNGWLLGKIPGLNQLNFNLVLGGHVLSTVGNKPYYEYSVGLDNIGWGKYRLLRIDYVRSSLNGVNDGIFVFGLKFLDFLD